MPDELDPQVKEFTIQLRRLLDRDGLSVAAVADRTGYSKTSWERYLGGRLLAPKGAVVALAEVTGTDPVHLTTMWELAERAWSRAEMRHDMTMEAIRISQARAALEESGTGAHGRAPGRKGGTATVAAGAAGPAGGSAVIPTQPTAPDADARGEAVRAPAAGGTNSWKLAGYQGPSPTARRTPGPAAMPPSPGPRPDRGPAPAPAPAVPGGAGKRRDGVGKRRGGVGKRRLAMFLAGAAGMAVLTAAAFYLTGGGDEKSEAAEKRPAASASAVLPHGVKCAGAGCTGKDAERMGCTGRLVTTAKTATVGATVLEVRYSKTCGAVWARITGAAPGDRVKVGVGKLERSGAIADAGDTIAYTPMMAVKDAGEAKACATLASGGTGCTR